MEELKNIFLRVVKENYFNLNGRARRREYWMYTLALMILGFGIGILLGIFGAISETLGSILGVVLMIAYLAILAPSIAVSVRRLHDVNKSGWFLLINLIPFGGLYILYLMVTEGDKGPNQYGEDPKA